MEIRNVTLPLTLRFPTLHIVPSRWLLAFVFNHTFRFYRLFLFIAFPIGRPGVPSLSHDTRLFPLHTRS